MNNRRFYGCLIFVVLCFVFWTWLIFGSNGLNREYTIKLIHYKSVLVEKHTKQFEFDKNEKYSSLKFFKYYVTDEYGYEHEVEKVQFDTIHLKNSFKPDSIEFVNCGKSYQIKK